MFAVLQCLDSAPPTPLPPSQHNGGHALLTLHVAPTVLCIPALPLPFPCPSEPVAAHKGGKTNALLLMVQGGNTYGCSNIKSPVGTMHLCVCVCVCVPMYQFQSCSNYEVQHSYFPSTLQNHQFNVRVGPAEAPSTLIHSFPPLLQCASPIRSAFPGRLAVALRWHQR